MGDLCQYGYGVRYSFPKEIGDADRGFKECCFENLVLADLASTDDWRNDYTGFYYRIQAPGETVTFYLVECDNANNEIEIVDDTFGIWTPVGGHATQPDLATFIVEWRKVSDVLGTGNYQIKQTIEIGAVPAFSQLSNTFTLKDYNTTNADKSVRIAMTTDGLHEQFGVDFKGTGFKTSLRLPGFFGDRTPSYQETIVKRRNYKDVQVSMRQKNEYTANIYLIPDCIFDELEDFVLMGNELFVSDYNINNNSYDLFNVPVKLVDTEDPEYSPVTRKVVQRVLKFEDRFDNRIKRNC